MRVSQESNTSIELIHVTAAENMSGRSRLVIPEESPAYNEIEALVPLGEELVRRLGENVRPVIDAYVKNPPLSQETIDQITSLRQQEDLPKVTADLLRYIPSTLAEGQRAFPAQRHSYNRRPGMMSRTMDLLQALGTLVETEGRSKHEGGYFNDAYNAVTDTEAVEAAFQRLDNTGLRRLIKIGKLSKTVKPGAWFPGEQPIHVDMDSLARYQELALYRVNRFISIFRPVEPPSAPEV